MSIGAQRINLQKPTITDLLHQYEFPSKNIKMDISDSHFIFDNSKEKPIGNAGNSESDRNNNKNNNFSNRNLILMNDEDSNLKLSPFTKEMFLEYYAMGKENLSTIECPDSLEGISFLKAPEAYYEIRRLNTVERFMNLPHWDHSNRFSMLLKKMTSMFNCSGASLSLIDSRFQVIKFERGLGFDKCSRQASIDSHTILSNNFFLILDTIKDWRFKSNPIVKGLPNIRFYLGIPLITSNKQAIGVLSIFDSFARNNVDESTIKIMKKMSSEIMEYLESSVKKKSNDHSKGNTTNSTKRLLDSTCLTTTLNNDINNNESNSKRLLEIYGRATSNNKFNDEIIFENDGSGNSYKYNSNLKFSKFSFPYDDLIDLNVWNQLSKSNNLRKAANLLCDILIKKLDYESIFIINIKESKSCWINQQFYPINEREIEIEKYKFKDKIEWDKEGFENIDEFGNMQMKVVGIKSKNENIGKQIVENDYNNEFYGKSIRSINGLNYYCKDDDNVIFHCGFCLPFYRYGNKLIRKRRVKSSLDKNESIELFFKRNGYLIACFDSKNREITDNEIGYVYGCASILRRIFFY